MFFSFFFWLSCKAVCWWTSLTFWSTQRCKSLLAYSWGMQVNWIHFGNVVLLHLRWRRTSRVCLRKLDTSASESSKGHFIWFSGSVVGSSVVLLVAVLVDIQGRSISLIAVVNESLSIYSLMLCLKMLTRFKSVILRSKGIFISLCSIWNI